MSLIEVILLAIALSIDACVVSFTYGLITEKQKRLSSVLLASFTGFFQFLMPILGFYFANLLQSYIQSFANIIVFLIFGYLGIKFIKEAFQKEKHAPKCLGLACLFMIAVATSIDAFSAGISLLLCGNKIIIPSLIIGIITFINSLFGFWGGFILKKFPAFYLEITGGIILIGLGLKALIFG